MNHRIIAQQQQDGEGRANFSVAPALLSHGPGRPLSQSDTECGDLCLNTRYETYRLHIHGGGGDKGDDAGNPSA